MTAIEEIADLNNRGRGTQSRVQVRDDRSTHRRPRAHRLVGGRLHRGAADRRGARGEGDRNRAARTRAMAPPRRTTATVEVVEIGGEDRTIILRGLTDDDVRAFADGLGRQVRVTVEVES